MSLLQSEMLGAVVPQIVHRPPDVASLAAAEEAIELANAYGICGGYPLDESQEYTLRVALGERADGSWAATTVGDTEPRQNGKNDTINARELAGLVLFGEQLIIHTAHEFPTANESFLRLEQVFQNWDDLRRMVRRFRYGNGEQAIEMMSGGRLKYKARTGGGARGFAGADLIVFDEHQHVQPEHIAAAGPARIANPNSQAWYSGSGGLSTSANSWRMRRRALSGQGGRFAYVEHTAEQVSVVDGTVKSERPDPLDREAWATANPAYGRRITDESMMGLYEELGPELFARECLCVWDPEPNTDGAVWVVPEDKYKAGNRADSKITGTPSLAIAVEPLKREWSALAAAGTGTVGGVHAGVLKYERGTDWLADEIKRWGTEVAIAKDSAAASLVPELKAAGITVVEFNSTEQGAAFGQVFDLAIAGDFYHPDQAELETSVKHAELRLTEGGVSVLSPKRSSVDISPLVAVTLATSKHLQPASAPAPRLEWL